VIAGKNVSGWFDHCFLGRLGKLGNFSDIVL
jgi:hypothetical protein